MMKFAQLKFKCTVETSSGTETGHYYNFKNEFFSVFFLDIRKQALMVGRKVFHGIARFQFITK